MTFKQTKLSDKSDDIKELTPTLVENNSISSSFNLDASDLIINNENSSDSFFKKVVGELTNNTNISQKTEYRDVTENFAGTKLEFLAKYGGMPYLSKFVNIFETKRVSLERKGRKELVMVMQEKQQEIIRENAQKMHNMFNMG